MLSDLQLARYARHVALREVGGVGQERLLGARVAIEGKGLLAEWALAYLAAAGVGEVAVPAGWVAAARARAGALNPDCRVVELGGAGAMSESSDMIRLWAGDEGPLNTVNAAPDVAAGPGWVTARPCRACFKPPRLDAPFDLAPALAAASGAAAAAELMKLVVASAEARPLARRVLFFWPGPRVEMLAGCEACR